MKTIQICVISLCCILSLIPLQASASKLVPFMTFANNYPSNRYTSGFVTATDIVKVVVTWADGGTLAPVVKQIIDGVKSDYAFAQN